LGDSRPVYNAEERSDAYLTESDLPEHECHTVAVTDGGDLEYLMVDDDGNTLESTLAVDTEELI